MPISKPFRLCLLTTIFFTPALAYADDTLPQLVVTATGVASLLPDVPAGVTVITQADMKTRGDVTLVQALAAVPGLGVVQSGGPGSQASVFIRGADSNQVLLLLNGVPVNDPGAANGGFNFGEYTLTDIARIEIVRGPMSGLYGADAIGGVINIITVQGVGQGTGKPKLSIEAAGGFPAQGQGSATISGKTGKFDYALTGALNEQAGFDDNAKRLAAYSGHRQPFRARLGDLNAGYTLAEGTRVYLNLRVQQTDAGSTASPNYDDPDDYLYQTNFFGKFGISSTLLNGLLSTDLFIGYLETNLRNINLPDDADPNQASAQDHFHGYREDAQWNNTIHVPDFGPASFTSLLFGVEYGHDTARENAADSAYYGISTANFTAFQHTIAGHLGVQTTLWNRLTVTAAGRDDAVSSFGSALTGRVGAVLAVPEADLHLKASYGTGFLAPSLFDLYGVSNSYGTLYSGNPHLRPETSSGYDAGAQFDIPAFDQADAASLSASYFSNSINNLIETVYNSSFTQSTEANINRAHISGVEAEINLNPAPWLQADFTYTYTYARDLTGRSQLLRRPENAGSAVVTISPTSKLSVAPQLHYIGKFSDYLYLNNGNSGGNPLTGVGTADPGMIVNLAVNYALTPDYALFADADNLLQSKFEPVNAVQIPGQSFLFGIRAVLQ